MATALKGTVTLGWADAKNNGTQHVENVGYGPPDNVGMTSNEYIHTTVSTTSNDRLSQPLPSILAFQLSYVY